MSVCLYLANSIGLKLSIMFKYDIMDTFTFALFSCFPQGP